VLVIGGLLLSGCFTDLSTTLNGACFVTGRKVTIRLDPKDLKPCVVTGEESVDRL
jgi:hypothetical protein